MLADVVVNLVAHLAPAIDGAAQAEVLDRLHGSIEGDPAHDAGVGEGACRPANLPYTMVVLAPHLLEMAEQLRLQPPRFVEWAHRRLAGDE